MTNTIKLETKAKPVELHAGDEIRCTLRTSKHPKGDPLRDMIEIPEKAIWSENCEKARISINKHGIAISALNKWNFPPESYLPLRGTGNITNVNIRQIAGEIGCSKKQIASLIDVARGIREARRNARELGR